MFCGPNMESTGSLTTSSITPINEFGVRQDNDMTLVPFGERKHPL